MDATVRGEAPELYYVAACPTDMRKRSLEWDPNEWRWDGDLFTATPLNRSKQLFPSNSSSSCSDVELNRDSCRDTEKKRSADDCNLSLNFGVAAGKKTKLGGAAICQVEDCRIDLTEAKDYHRRHKVCEVHSKASNALVANQMQRFCQQCSRFHALQEFDEGKRSCRRRLAGHNKRRRKAQQTDNASNNSPVIDNQTSGYLLISILKILSNLHNNDRSNSRGDQDLLSHLLQNLSSQRTSHLKESLNLLNNLHSLENLELLSMLLSRGSLGQRSIQEHRAAPVNEIPTNDVDLPVTSRRPGIVLHTQANSQIYAQGEQTSGGRGKLNNFDLNDVYVDSDIDMDYIERSTVPESVGTVSTECPTWAHQASPPETSANTDSASAQSPSSSSGEAQSHTDRIVFKLFGKEPSDFPLVLRTQIFDWLSHSPTDIESYIRPGCIILTIYLRLSESTWEELYCDLRSSLNRLLRLADDVSFWNTGWIYARVQNQMAFVYNGQVVVNYSLPCGTDSYSTILSVKPIAVTPSGQTEFVVRGFSLSRPSTRLLCALEGNYLETHCESTEHVDGLEGQIQCLKFTCSVPTVTGRGFIEVEDNGLSSTFSPFIVAEYNICTEIRMLEKEIELIEIENLQRGAGNSGARNQAMEFIHEMGWLFHKFQLKSRLEQELPDIGLFPFDRFRALVEFSVDRDWCCVVNKLLDILFYGIVEGGEQPFLKFALSEMSLLHRAVRRNSRSMVEMLLTYIPEKVAEELRLEYKTLVEVDQISLFRPDVAGPGGLTPLHIAAGRDGSEDTLDALTDDPGKVGVLAWKSAFDSAGFTPEGYARLRGHYSYIHLVQRKVNKNAAASFGSGHVVVNISETIQDNSISINQKSNAEDASGFEIQQAQRPCGVCAQKLSYKTGSRTFLYKPAMLSMLAVAAVCVCVALLFKSLPELSVPFSWEMLEFGSS
ncbi:Squamosa promoter-binding-like protein 1 [Striga hermonthica]|uniref:Squamosa promoter-binding-like protein 1 n=1 Tax=Striga hermonthica TaxID=68872 RepID=A0A9N7N1V9_STRHE|nr:Squamosa promoter-binding-like protein 1 [Striga hermonthica]